jgi:ABC-2 type transport system permease protein
MQVFKAYFKIIKKNFSSLAIYLIIFLFLTVLLSTFNTNNNTSSFTGVKTKVTFFNDDENSALLDGFKIYLSENTNLVNLEDNKEKIQDALFFRNTEYVIRIPKGFTKAILEKSEIDLEKTSIPLSAGGVFTDSLINKYFNSARIYINSGTETDQNKIVQYIKNDLSLQTAVEVKSFGTKDSLNESIVYYFNYFAYSLFAILILGVSTIMMVFNKKDLRMRNTSSPLSIKSMNFQLLLGNLLFAFITWLLLVIFSFILFSKTIFTLSTVFLLINSFVFTLACLSISFLIGNLIKGRNAQQAISNVFTLGTCFIAGVFVPQALLGKSVLTLASFTPTYWYVKANNQIGAIVNFSSQNLTPIIYNMLIVFGFAVAILAVSLVVVKYKRTSN